MTKYFTSDPHFGHANVIKYTNRPWKTVEEMDEGLITNWNNTVRQQDEVYIIGDFALCRPEKAVEILQRLNGIKYLIKGNHDKGCLKSHEFRNMFVWIESLKEIKVEDPSTERGTQPITLCHYGMRVWNKSHHGAHHYYGHSHGSLPPEGKSMDVGVDSPFITGKAEYRPYSYQEIKAVLANVPISVVDHHGD